MTLKESCIICDAPYNSGDYAWYQEDKSINLPKPPKDLPGVYICRYCYTDGPSMEQRIRYAIKTRSFEEAAGRKYSSYWIPGYLPSKINLPEKIRCDCGGEKARTTHSSWCSMVFS